MEEKPETPANTPMNTDAPASGSKAPEQERTPERKGLSFPVFLLLVVLVSLSFRSFGFSLYNIPSESMLPRLMVGDYLAASKWNYGYTRNSLPLNAPLIPGRVLASQPERGDVVIFKHPIDGTDYIKRVIGLPGDIVQVEAGRVILNGDILPQTPTGDVLVQVSENTSCAWGAEQERLSTGTMQCRYTAFRETLPNGVTYKVLDFGRTPQDDYGSKVVPEGMLFLMGDNRDNSQDSRFPPEAKGGVGFVPQKLLVGKAQRILWSTDGGAQWLKPWTWFTAARSERMGNDL